MQALRRRARRKEMMREQGTTSLMAQDQTSPPRQRRMRASDRRHQIMQTSIRVFAEEGYGNATTAKIAAAAGITEPTIYMHFKSKKELFISLLDATYTFMKALLEAFRDQEGDIYTRYREAIKGLCLIMEDPESIKLAKLWIIASTVNDPDVSSYVSRFDETMMTLFCESLRQAEAKKQITLKYPPEVFGRLIVALANNLATETLTKPRISRDQFEGVLELFLSTLIERHCG